VSERYGKEHKFVLMTIRIIIQSAHFGADLLKIYESDYSDAKFGDIRTATTETGEPLFCLAYLCRALNLTTTANVAKRIDEDDVYSIHSTDSLDRNQSLTFVSEAGM
jgi:hypothetical protein